MSSAAVIKGVVHGKTIELDREPGLPDGQEVTVSIQPTTKRTLPPGEGLRRAFGAWADRAAEVDEFLKQLRQDRDGDRRAEPEP